MKYIDADRLRKAVEKKYNSNDTVGDRWDLGYDTACEQILEIIDSLQQEQQEIDLEKEMDRFFGMYRNSKGETFDITDNHHCFDWKEEESAGADMRIARYFYELGASKNK